MIEKCTMLETRPWQPDTDTRPPVSNVKQTLVRQTLVRQTLQETIPRLLTVTDAPRLEAEVLLSHVLDAALPVTPSPTSPAASSSTD